MDFAEPSAEPLNSQPPEPFKSQPAERRPPIFLAVILFAGAVYVFTNPNVVRQASDLVSKRIELRSLFNPHPPEQTPAPAPTEKPKTARVVAAQPRMKRAAKSEPKASRPAPQSAAVAEHATVAADAAVVYSSNSADGSVTHVLRKGDSVESRLEVVDSKGSWRLVHAPDNWSGFVRSETLTGAPPRDDLNLTIVR